MARLAFVSRNVVTPDGVRPAAIVVEDGRIVSLENPSALPTGYEIIDAGDDHILPGLVDTHVHINEPGRTEWEGFVTATRAAAAGGYTTLVDMPLNCLPATTTVEALNLKRKAAEGKTWIDWAAWGGVVPGNAEEIAPMAEAGVRGFKCFLVHPGCEGFAMVGEADLRAAMPLIRKTGLPLLVHAELAGPIEAEARELVGRDWNEYQTYADSRPHDAECEAVELMIGLCREYGTRLHIVHVSSILAVQALDGARREGLPITLETCPHYLLWESERILRGGVQFKCAPPIRSGTNREILWQGLEHRMIDLIATDHSPCPPEMKTGNFRTAWGGIASLSVALPAMWAEALRRGFRISHIARWMSEAPTRLAGLEARKGAIEAGRDADLVVFDPNLEWTVTRDDLHFRHKYSPYVGWKVRGRVKATYVRGREAFGLGSLQGGGFAKTPFGREVGSSGS